MSKPHFKIEQSYAGRIIAGVDEAGRGPWAGPVVAGAVILNAKKLPKGADDSKKLNAARREELLEIIMACAQVGVGVASVAEIDELNILGATKLAMCRAVEALPVAPCLALVDGNRAPPMKCEVQTIIKGDAISLSIAAASIVAKVHRDRLMQQLALEHPGYGWEQNAGYGTQLHQDGLAKHGVTIHHRRSFRPIRELLEQSAAA